MASASVAPAAAIAATPAAAAPATASATATATATATAGGFTDIAGNVNASAITALAQLGVLDATSGAFHPDDPIKRRDFVRWLFKTNNAVFANSPSHTIHPASSSEVPLFKDVPASDPDFPYVQGMADAGNSVGFPDGTFRGDAVASREQAIAIKAILDHGGINKMYAGAKDAGFARYQLPAWKDKGTISVTFVGAVAEDNEDEGDKKVDNIGRTWGAISIFRPQAAVTRGEAATMLQTVGGHAEIMMYDNAMRTVAAALAPSPSPSP